MKNLNNTKNSFEENSLEDILERIIQKQKKENAGKGEIVRLPTWPESVRGTPTAILRSALFAAIKPSNRKAMQREVIASLNGIEIRATGIQLSQFEMDIWEHALHLSRKVPLGCPIEFYANDFLRKLGKSIGGDAQRRLKKSLALLMGCGLEVTIKDKYTYAGTLLEYCRDEEKGHYLLRINPHLKNLFDAGWTEIDFKQRALLRRKPLAQWLHLFLATHKKPFSIRVATYQRLSGSQNKDASRFTQALKKALKDLNEIGYIRNFTIQKGIVEVERSSNNIQKIHAPK